MNGALVGWSVFGVLLIATAIAAFGAVHEAQKAFTVIRIRPRPAKFVIRGLEVLSAVVFGVFLTIALSLAYFFINGEAVLFELRVAIFYVFMAFVPCGFASIAWGFRQIAADITRMRKHWAYLQGAHLAADPIASDAPIV